MKPKHQRLVFIVVTLFFLCIATLLVLRAFSENLVFFFSPSELAEKQINSSQTIRVGGLVVAGSIRQDAGNITFAISDGDATLIIYYSGIVPNLFREGQGIIAEGSLKSKTEFTAKRILTKHDENYMPKEIVDSLKKTGHWKEPEKGANP